MVDVGCECVCVGGGINPHFPMQDALVFGDFQSNDIKEKVVVYGKAASPSPSCLIPCKKDFQQTIRLDLLVYELKEVEF